MKIIKYNLCTKINHGTLENPVWQEILSDVQIPWNIENETIAQKEAYNGEYTIEDNGVEEIEQPTQLDIIEAQVTYTAMMTNTLLEV